ARVGNQPVIRRSVLTLSGHAAPEVGVPSAHADGIVLSGFVERVGDPVPLVAADGSSHHADQLLVDALQAMVHARRGFGGRGACGGAANWAGANPGLAPQGGAARVIPRRGRSVGGLPVNP